MQASELEDTIVAMTVVAADEKSVEVMIKYAGETSEPLEDEETPELTPLTEARSAAVDALFMMYSPSLETPIELSALASAKLEAGPARDNSVAEGMKAMDANNDGKVEIDEMRTYFQFVGSELDDASFGLVIDTLKDSVAAERSLQLAKTLGL